MKHRILPVILVGIVLIAGFFLLVMRRDTPQEQPPVSNDATKNLETKAPAKLPAIPAFSPKATEHMTIAHDFNGDGQPEMVAYSAEPITLGGMDKTKYRVKVYRWDGATWVIDHEDEGTSGTMYIDKDFFHAFDLDGDGVQEAQITKRRDGTGQFRQSYILKWNGTTVTDVFYPKEETVRAAARRLLNEGESLSEQITYTGTKGSFAVCTKGENFCESRASSANPVGSVLFDVSYANGATTAINLERVR